MRNDARDARDEKGGGAQAACAMPRRCGPAAQHTATRRRWRAQGPGAGRSSRRRRRLAATSPHFTPHPHDANVGSSWHVRAGDYPQQPPPRSSPALPGPRRAGQRLHRGPRVSRAFVPPRRASGAEMRGAGPSKCAEILETFGPLKKYTHKSFGIRSKNLSELRSLPPVVVVGCLTTQIPRLWITVKWAVGALRERRRQTTDRHTLFPRPVVGVPIGNETRRGGINSRIGAPQPLATRL